MERRTNGPAATTLPNVNFIVGDDSPVVNGNSIHVDLQPEDEEGIDMFPPSPGMCNNNSSYNSMFGLADRRRRLR